MNQYTSARFGVRWRIELTLCRDKGWLKARSRQRADSTHVLAAIRGITRLECVEEAVQPDKQ
jgi:hypothetical protein